MNEDYKYNLIAKYLAGECSEEEVVRLTSMLESNPEYQKVLRELKSIWSAKKEKPMSWEVEKSWRLLSKKIEVLESGETIKNKAKPRSFRPNKRYTNNGMLYSRYARFAAAFLVIGMTVLISVLYLNTQPIDEQVIINELETERGQRAEIRLADGSEIKMSVESKLSYPEQFSDDFRSVHLSGEAYFDIEKDERPFIVYADHAIIEIIGTEFNIKAYSDQNDVQVLVTEGSVNLKSISDEKSSEPASLEKGNFATLNKNGSMTVQQDVDFDDYLAWMNRKISFENTPLFRVTDTLERWYGIEFRYSNPELKNMGLSATFDDAPLPEILRVIEIALELKIDVRDNEIMISKSDTK